MHISICSPSLTCAAPHNLPLLPSPQVIALAALELYLFAPSSSLNQSTSTPPASAPSSSTVSLPSTNTSLLPLAATPDQPIRMLQCGFDAFTPLDFWLLARLSNCSSGSTGGCLQYDLTSAPGLPLPRWDHRGSAHSTFPPSPKP